LVNSSQGKSMLPYLQQRGLYLPELIEHMRIGYAPGGCLRGWLTRLGYSLPVLCQAGLVTTRGYDTYIHRVVFPLDGNLYGRSLSTTAPPHRFLRGSKGGLYVWEQVRQCPEVILVEGLFDYAVLWQAGFHNVTARWETISMHASSGNCATAAREPSLSPLMPTATVAGSKRRNGWQASSARRA
jgi:DNA primase